MGELCKACNKELNKSQYRKGDKYKSCPNCSTKNGKEHVYYLYPENFGTTPKRASTKRPDGPQSHCESCRFDRDSHPKQILCSEINNL